MMTREPLTIKDIKPDYIEYTNGTKEAILWRAKGSLDTEPCPFCKKRHWHGQPEGGRSPHCVKTDRKFNPQYTAKDGAILHQQDGYHLKEYEPTPGQRSKDRAREKKRLSKV
jgi:hypothetical protein